MADANDSTATQSLETTQTGSAPTNAAAGGAPADGGATPDAGDAGGAAAGGAAAGDAGAGGDPLDAPGILDGVDGDGKPAGEGEGEGDKGGEGEGGEGGDAAAPLTGEAPEAYEVTPPEGFTMDKAALDMFDPVFRKLGLTNAGAQEIVNLAPQYVQHIADATTARVVGDVVAVRKQWAEEAAADPEIGGARFEESKTLAAKAFDRLGFAADGKFRTFLKESGLGNHPEMIRAMVKMGRAIGEDGFDRGEAGKADVPIWDRVYGGPTPSN